MLNYRLEDVDEVAVQLLELVNTKTLLFYGDMGVGKTTLIKSLVKTLGSEDEVSSPTFSIVNEYLGKDEKIFHFDLYRVSSLEEAMDFGIEDYLNTDNWCFIEWPQTIESYLKSDYNYLKITTNADASRSIEIKFNQLNNAPNHVH